MCYFYLHLSLLLLFDVYVLKRVALKLPMFQFPFRTVKTFKMLKIRDEFLSVSARVQPLHWLMMPKNIFYMVKISPSLTFLATIEV